MCIRDRYSDPGVSWREDSKKIVINFGDNVPHDCDVYYCIGGEEYSTGVDPGRNGTPGDGDDLAIMNVICGLAGHDITLIHVSGSSSSDYLDVWDCWARMTPSGSAVYHDSYTGNLADLIAGKIDELDAPKGSLTLVPDAPYASWIHNMTPEAYFDVTPGEYTFSFDICMPCDAEIGYHVFDICAVVDDEVIGCERDVIYNLGSYRPYPEIQKIEYHTVEFSWSSWKIRVCVRGNDAYAFRDAILYMSCNEGDVTITDPVCAYPLLESDICGAPGDVFEIDMSERRSTFSFWVGMDVLLKDECGYPYPHNANLILKLTPPFFKPEPIPYLSLIHISEPTRPY